MNAGLLDVAHVGSCYISKILLTNFRSYGAFSVEAGAGPVVIAGANGIGKTNILEAISFLSPGRGFRSAKLEDIDRRCSDGVFPWAVNFDINVANDGYNIGTAKDSSLGANKRLIKINGVAAKSQSSLAEILSVIWLVPQMDGLFIGPSNLRRKFLDKMVVSFDPEHSSRIYAYEYKLKQRMKLLQENGDLDWISVLEGEIAQYLISIAASRSETLKIIQQSIFNADGTFPKALLQVKCEIQEMLVGGISALQVEEFCKSQLFDNRQKDMLTSRTNFGVHRSDLLVTHIDKNMLSQDCSTGEQKAMLIAIVLAEARARAMWRGSTPILLLDEVIAHLDEVRRVALFDELLSMNAQIWMTGVDKSHFDYLQGKASFIDI